MKRLISLFAGLVVSLAMTFAAWAGVSAYSFSNIDGGQLDTGDWAGRPVLVVNTASQCAYTPQYDQLQTLYDRYKARGLIVLAVPSDDFSQELNSAAEVKEFCELTFGLDMPMTDITHVRGAAAHPFYAQVRSETGFEPSWNFNKVLIGPDGQVAATWRARVEPLSSPVTEAIEALLD